MASPLPVITVTGRFVTLGNAPAEGYITLTPVVRVAGQGYIVVGCTQVAYIRDGVVNATIIADSVDLSEHLFVQVTEVIACPDTTPFSYVIEPQGSTLDLSTVPRVTTPPAGQLYIPATALGQPGGVATLGPDGILTASQRPVGSSLPSPVFVHTQSVPQSVFFAAHNLGRRPAAIALFSLDYAVPLDEFDVLHIDANNLRVAMDLPTACVALIE